MNGRQIGRYRVVSQLGAGGMGEVFLAEDTVLGRRVALKLLKPSTDASPDRNRRFLDEARLASSLSHPYIAQIFELGEDAGETYIAMEYIEGERLDERIRKSVFTPAEVIDLATQLCEALEEAHTKGIVHRDLKPANIIITPRGRVKVLDFGLAKRLSTGVTDDAVTRQTDPGLVLGTVQYMSPEQALGHNVDARSDIFSAGVVLYEAITGRLPFVAPSITETLDRIVHRPPDSVSRLNYATPPELERIVRKMLEKEPTRRYQNARDLLIDLNNLKRDSDSQVSARPKAAMRTRTIVDSLAVLPLDASSDDQELEYLADGITESLINALSQLPKLKVMARSTVFRYKKRDIDPQTIGRDLGVRGVLIGRLQHVRGQVIIRAELVNADDGTHLWGAQFQRQANETLTIEEELAKEIADQLRLKLTRDDRKRLQKRHTNSEPAYEAYLRGRFYLAQRTSEGFARATKSFEQAIASDPRYALAYTGLADCYTLIATAGYVSKPRRMRRFALGTLRKLQFGLMINLPKRIRRSVSSGFG